MCDKVYERDVKKDKITFNAFYKAISVELLQKQAMVWESPSKVIKFKVYFHKHKMQWVCEVSWKDWDGKEKFANRSREEAVKLAVKHFEDCPWLLDGLN
jgi:hypothetical protein